MVWRERSQVSETYDYVIIGAGAAGCALAHRLSEDLRQRVLLVEAGGSDRVLPVKIPAAFTKLFGTERDYAYRTEPAAALAERRLYWPRGKMIGGSSSMNAQMYVRGHRADYDGWGAMGNEGWSWADAERLFARIEQRADGPNPDTDKGMQRIEAQRDPNRTTRHFLAACQELGLRALTDLNEPDNEGYALTAVMQKRGQRFSAADAYLTPALKRPNLVLRTHVEVRRVLFEGPRAVAVELIDRDGKVGRVRASYEIVLCAGAIGSPHILLRSGVGSEQHLRSAGVTPVTDLRGVGENLQDHLMVAVIRSCPEPVTLVSAESPRNLLKYVLQRRGMLTSCVGEAAAFVRSDPRAPAPDLELIFAPVPYIDHGSVKPEGHGLSIAPVLLQPESRGRIRLHKGSPMAAPRIVSGYLEDASGKDLDTLIRGVELAQRLFSTRAFGHLAGRPMEPTAVLGTREELEAFVREQAETLYHPVGTCSMGPDPRSAVVDARLRVHGLPGLRVADASIIPRIIRGHTCAPTLMIAEKAAELILEDRRQQERPTRPVPYAGPGHPVDQSDRRLAAGMTHGAR